MLNTAALARVAHGLLGTGTLNSTTLSIAFMEFLANSDSNALKAMFCSHGFKDVSPLWGNQLLVPSFKSRPDIIARWPEFQQAMTEVEADWYYLSGHHGRRFRSDGANQDSRTHLNGQEHVGFFNEHYHHGPWDHGAPDNPDAHASPRDVYMSTSTADWVYELGPTDNPLYSAPHTQCRGVMLVGCNTLIYKKVRQQLVHYFPNAVVIGLMSRETSSITAILRVAHQHGRQFFTDPKSIDPVDLCNELNPNAWSPDKLGVISDGVCYFRVNHRTYQFPATEDLPSLE